MAPSQYLPDHFVVKVRSRVFHSSSFGCNGAVPHTKSHPLGESN